MTPAALLQIATDAAQAAGQELVARLPRARTVDFKEGARTNLVTDADRASEAVILDVLAQRCPTHAILAEESGAKSGAGAFTWFIDPLDGTTNYAHGVPHFCVTLGVEGPLEGVGRTLLAGVVFDPVRQELFAATHGGGTTLNGAPVRVSGVAQLERALMSTGFPYDLAQQPDAPLGLFNRIVRRAQGMRRMGSAALDLAYVACGRFDGFFEFGLKPWDIAAGALLVREAGGAIAQIDGAPFDVRVGDIVAASQGLFDALAAETNSFVTAIGFRPRRFE